MMYTYKNSFHNTTALSKYSPEQLRAGWLYEGDQRSPDQVRRARRAGQRLKRKLCGVSGCTCGDTWYGERK